MRKLQQISLYWVCQFCGWGSLGLTNLFFAYLFYGEISLAETSKSVIICLTGILSSHLLRSFIKLLKTPLSIQVKAIWKIFPMLIISSLLFGIIIIIVYDFFDLSGARSDLPFFHRLIMNSATGTFFLLPWLLIYFSYHYIKNFRRQEMDTLRLNSLLKELELKTIKSYLNPHFLFNSLNSIRALIEEDSERAKNGVLQLRNIFRNSIAIEKFETVEFGVELAIVKDYLSLESIRFEERLHITYEIDERTMKLPVPPMMLQTLVENAVKHGISKLIEGGIVRISSTLNQGFHELTIENSGFLKALASDGFGIMSTKQRLVLLFGDNASFEITNTPKGNVLTVIRIPMRIVNRESSPDSYRDVNREWVAGG